MVILSEKNQKQKVCIWKDTFLSNQDQEVNSVVLPLEENLMSWISIRYVYSSQTLECSSKKGHIKYNVIKTSQNMPNKN